MGRTVASYRLALDDEIGKWNGFLKVLRVEDGEAFEELIGACNLFFVSGLSNSKGWYC